MKPFICFVFFPQIEESYFPTPAGAAKLHPNFGTVKKLNLRSTEDSVQIWQISLCGAIRKEEVFVKFKEKLGFLPMTLWLFPICPANSHVRRHPSH